MKTHCPIEVLELHVGEWTDLDDSCVINEDVDPAKMLEGLLDRRLNLRRLEQIAGDGQYLCPESGEVTFCASKFISIARKKCDSCAATAELTCDFKSKSARAAANQGNFVSKVERHSATFNV